MEKKRVREWKEGREKKASYFICGEVACLFRVVEQIYIALSPPVIPLSRCCRMLDRTYTEGRLKGKKGKGWKKKEKYRILKYRRSRHIAEVSRALCMRADRAFISPRAVFAKDYPCDAPHRASSRRARLFSVARYRAAS